MQVVHDIFSDEIRDFCVQTIGGFDGVHLGHQYLLQQMKEAAAQIGAKTMVVTFREHPSATLHPQTPVRQLTTLDEKLALLESMGIDYVAVLDFNQQMAQISACRFMEEILVEQLKGRLLIVGYDHRFGRKSDETFADYQKYGKELGIEVRLAHELPTADLPIGKGTHVSSSAIRRALSNGEISLANTLLNRLYSIEGIVTRGEGIGRTIGFPTANIALTDNRKMLPRNGAYAVNVVFEGDVPARKHSRGMLYIGSRPTLEGLGQEQRIEVNILDFNEEIYGQRLRLEFLAFIREEQRFDSLEELRQQLEQDLEIIKHIFI